LFATAWVFHAFAAEGRFFSRVTLTMAMNRQREAWMRTMARRDLRMIDTSIMLGLQQGTAFFASSTLIAIGGCFAMLGAGDRTLSVFAELPFAGPGTRAVFELKLLGLIAIFAYSFFKFGWSYRLFNYCSILIGSVPTVKDEAHSVAETEAAVRRAAQMNILGGQHFNGGLRGIFFSVGYLGWFVGSAAFAASTLLVLAVLVRRQFFSAARQAALDQGAGNTESIRPSR